MATTQFTIPNPSAQFKLHCSWGGLFMLAGLAWFLPLGIVALLAHELGHVAVARYNSVRVKVLGMRAMGPYIQRERSNRVSVELAITSAGIAVNLLLSFAFWGTTFGMMNLVLVITNIILPHSDGRRVWERLRALKVSQSRYTCPEIGTPRST